MKTVIPNDTDVLVKLTPAGKSRIMQYHHDQGLSPLLVKEQGYWRLPFWLFLDLFEETANGQFFDGHQLNLAGSEGPKFWVYHCSGCHQLVIMRYAALPKFHIFADQDAPPDIVQLLMRYYLACPDTRCHGTTYLSLEVDTNPPQSASSPTGRRPRHSRPADPSQPRRRRSRSRTRT